MEVKHTEGPWVVASGGNIIAESAHFGFTVASVETFTGRSVCPPDERHANARLIAAAPDLLESLKWAIKHVDNVFALAGRHDEELPQLLAARAAIARVEGRTP